MATYHITITRTDQFQIELNDAFVPPAEQVKYASSLAEHITRHGSDYDNRDRFGIVKGATSREYKENEYTPGVKVLVLEEGTDYEAKAEKLHFPEKLKPVMHY